MTYPQQQPQQAYAPPTPQQYAQPPAAQPQQAYAQPQFQQPPGTGQFFTQQDPHTQAQQSPAVAPPQFQQPPPMPMPEPAGPVDTSSFFGGAATISFDDRKGYQRGTYRGGQIISKSITQQTKMGTGEKLTWSDGSPRMQLVLLLQTRERTDPQDNGQRQLFIKGDAPRAARVAFEAAGAKDLTEGGWYYQAWVDEKPATQSGFHPQKIFKGLYALPGSPDPLADQPAYTAPPVQQYAPQPPPGPIGQIPQQVMAQAYQTVQQDPAMAAAAGWQPPQVQPPTAAPVQPSPEVPPPWGSPDQFAAFAAWQQQQAQQAAAMPPAGQFQPGGQMMAPQPAQPPTPQPGAAPEQWTPFST